MHGPCVINHDRNKEEAVKNAVDIMTSHPSGFDAILLVVMFNTISKNEGLEYLSSLLEHSFGQNVIENNVICIVTGKEQYELRLKFQKKSTDHPFHQWCEEEGGQIKDLFIKCNKRMMLFDTALEGTDNLHQLQELDRLIKQLNPRMRYTFASLPITAREYQKALGEVRLIYFMA